jgi:hypothetical protein
MDEIELQNRLEESRKDSQNCRYLLEVEGPTSYSGQQIKNPQLAWVLCEIAFESGTAKRIKLSYYLDANTQELLFDTSNPMMVETMKQTLKLRPKIPLRPEGTFYRRN